MKMETSQQGKTLVVKVLAPRVGADGAAAFKERVLELIREGQRTLLIDLSEVNFMDSAGLGVLVSCLKAMGTQGELAVCGAREGVASLFKLTRMDRVFRMFATTEEGVAALA